jgi:Domain of unknown function (DUF4434)
MANNKDDLPRRDILRALGSVPLAAFVPVLTNAAPAIAMLPRGHKEDAASESTLGQQQVARLQLIPPSPITDEIILDVRGAVENKSDAARNYSISLYRDQESGISRLHTKNTRVPAHGSVGIQYRFPVRGWAGRHRIMLVASGPAGAVRAECEVEVVRSKYRSTETIGGAWVDIVHWSEAEGRYYNAALRKLTCADWSQQIRGMHGIGMDVAVIQSVFLNNKYYGKNTIATSGYRGLAFYPSALFPGRVHIDCHDPLEAILSEADRLRMGVFLGVGMYAWFDYSAHSLEWHKKVAAELWNRYGHHRSLYGWYVAEEVDGGLGDFVPSTQGEKGRDRYRREIIDFFAGFQKFCRKLAPEKPVMLACNTFGMGKSRGVWPHVLKHVDIICPFGFGRMPEGDLPAQQAAQLWRTMCDETGTHLWMDMETFVFQGKALVPRPIQGIVESLHGLRNFEKILCYEYSGIFNSPQSKVKPGGLQTVTLYRDYLRYLRSLEVGGRKDL